MKKTKVIYWIFTGLVILGLVPGAILGLVTNDPEGTAAFAKLGFGAHLIPFISIAKLLGVIAVVVPGYPRIKEWAYAGLSFDLIGAMYAQIITQETAWPVMLVFIGVLAGSYIYYHKLIREKFLIAHIA
jgi:hypothetical protein